MGSSVKNGTLNISRLCVLDPRVSFHQGFNMYHLPCLLEMSSFFTLDPLYENTAPVKYLFFVVTLQVSKPEEEKIPSFDPKNPLCPGVQRVSGKVRTLDSCHIKVYYKITVYIDIPLSVATGQTLTQTHQFQIQRDLRSNPRLQTFLLPVVYPQPLTFIPLLLQYPK